MAISVHKRRAQRAYIIIKFEEFGDLTKKIRYIKKRQLWKKNLRWVNKLKMKKSCDHVSFK